LGLFLWERLSGRDLRAVGFSRLESRSHKNINAVRFHPFGSSEFALSGAGSLSRKLSFYRADGI
jgi:hypothetical protein